jgi:hypothetical protein
MLRDFKEAYYGVTEHESSNQITPIEFADLYPIFVLDVRRQAEKIKDAPQSIRLDVKFDSNVPAGTKAYAVIISDRLLKLKSDGKNFTEIL